MAAELTNGFGADTDIHQLGRIGWLLDYWNNLHIDFMV